MTIQEKINYLLAKGYSQTSIYKNTGIAQSSVSKISGGDQTSVSYEKGIALDRMVSKCRKTPRQATA